MRVHGDNAKILEHSGKVKSDRFGLWTGRCRWSILATRSDLLPLIGELHPLADWMKVEDRDITFAAGRWLVDCSYVGVEPIDPVPVYELQRNTNTEPIETHEKFVTTIAGKPSAPLNGALFVDEDGNPTADDKRGIFHRFRLVLESGERNPFAGMTGYLSASNTLWTKSWTSRTKPTDGGAVGKIDTPEGGPPSFSGCTWIYSGLQFTERVDIYSVRKVWMLSAPGGWNSVVYGP
ncbi:hypothetical protein UFOVP736_27 [uncultured Caudovirales phage]|uniref:Uncharacterized protein n=1 Tax=uncultured Caudovirales phage TaxID=2100421 RepID=A0A6J5NKA0_9CAUD|nr:hypothetical protein UFOVP705_54 [uncultured Caudovirales phage]CAB5224028.1 hypothetical protein UFOVP736_27 [uncultured Caudovirales phage]